MLIKNFINKFILRIKNIYFNLLINLAIILNNNKLKLALAKK